MPPSSSQKTGSPAPLTFDMTRPGGVWPRGAGGAAGPHAAAPPAARRQAVGEPVHQQPGTPLPLLTPPHAQALGGGVLSDVTCHRRGAWAKRGGARYEPLSLDLVSGRNPVFFGGGWGENFTVGGGFHPPPEPSPSQCLVPAWSYSMEKTNALGVPRTQRLSPYATPRHT